jgi:hypothetical protein
VYEELKTLIVDKILTSYNMPSEVATWMKEVRDDEGEGGEGVHSPRPSLTSPPPHTRSPARR